MDTIGVREMVDQVRRQLEYGNLVINRRIDRISTRDDTSPSGPTALSPLLAYFPATPVLSSPVTPTAPSLSPPMPEHFPVPFSVASNGFNKVTAPRTTSESGCEHIIECVPDTPQPSPPIPLTPEVPPSPTGPAIFLAGRTSPPSQPVAHRPLRVHPMLVF